MSEKSFDALPEVFLSNKEISPVVSRGLSVGLLRLLAPRLYTRNLIDPPEKIVGRHLWSLVASYVPGAIVADRTALENVPTKEGSVFLAWKRRREVVLPGVTLRVRPGPAALESDSPFVAGLYLSSPARAYLDNLAPSRRRRAEVRRTLERAELEARLEVMLRNQGASALNRLRDQARAIAPAIGRDEEFARLERLIGALLSTRDEPLLTDLGNAWRRGTPYDPDRVALFEVLHGELRTSPPVTRPDPGLDLHGRETLTFFEAYFSNFIEGTEFAVGEAADIVFRNVIPVERPADAHDILGTWRIVSDPVEMARTPRHFAGLLELLRRRHATLMAARADKHPGAFKLTANRAGDTVFVDPALVEGTLMRGLELYRSLDTPFARAVYMMFLISEVHPFADGNGRVARMMMNAELAAASETRIVIPTVFRGDYLGGLKALSQSRTPTPLIRTLDYAQKWTAAVPWGELKATEAVLRRCNAFMESDEAENRGVRLRFPDASP